MQTQVPTYQKVGCPVCTERAAKIAENRAKGEFRPPCQGCDKPIPEYELGRVREGFDSCTIHHYHFKGVEGRSGYRIVKAKLCFECYLEDFKNTYPGVEYGAHE